MARRYAHIDVDFLHKTTAHKLTDELGIAAPLVFIALILRAKDGSPPGTFEYSSEAVAWERLGFDPEAAPFALSRFLEVTGKLRQTRRRVKSETRRSRVEVVTLTCWDEWQKESRRVMDAEKKRRKREQNAGDRKGTLKGTERRREGGPRTRSRTTPKPPLNGKQTHPLDCPTCGLRQPSRHALTHHLEHDHGQTP